MDIIGLVILGVVIFALVAFRSLQNRVQTLERDLKAVEDRLAQLGASATQSDLVQMVRN